MVHAIITIYYNYHFIEGNTEAQRGWISKAQRHRRALQLQCQWANSSVKE